MSASTDRSDILSTTSEIDPVIDLLGHLSLLATLPSDILITILGWLSMKDMLVIARVSSAWRQLALRTATLWWDVAVLGDIPPTQDVTRFLVLLHRSGSTRIRVRIVDGPLRGVSQALLDRLRATLDGNRRRITALQFPRADLYPCRRGCSLIGSASHLLRGLGAQGFSPPLRDEGRNSWEIVEIPSFNMHAIRRLIISKFQHRCPTSCSEVHDLEVDAPFEIIRPLERLVQQHPNTRILTVRACGLGDDPNPILQLRDLVELRIMYDSSGYVYWDALAPFIMLPVIRRVMVDMSSSGKQFLQLIRHSLKDLTSSEPWHVVLRSGRTPWPQNSILFTSDTTQDPKPHFTIELRLGDGRERIFGFHKFGEALERIVRPLLHDRRTTSVAVDGESALHLLYSGVGDADLSQIQILSVMTSDDGSLVVPLRRIGLPKLRLIVLERCTGRGSRLTTGRVESWLAGLRLDARPNLDLKNVFVYEEGGGIVSAVLSGACLYQRAWRQRQSTSSAL